MHLLFVLASTLCAFVEGAAVKRGGRCRIKRVDGRRIGVEAFSQLYRDKQPVILKHLIDGWRARGSWSRDVFVERYGRLQVALERQVPGTTSERSVRSDVAQMTLAEYIGAAAQQDIALSFDSYELHRALRPDIVPIPAHVSEVMAEPVFSLGRAGIGADFHRHDENWIAQVAGRKLWFTAAPDVEGLDDLQGLSPCSLRDSVQQVASMCVVKPGELIYLPNGWYHATCNLDDFTVGVGGRGRTTAAHRACSHCSLPDLHGAIETTAGAGALDVHGRPALYICAAAGCARGAELLLSANRSGLAAAVDFLDGGQPLHVAAKNGHVAVVELFARQGANLTATDARGMQPVHLAAYSGHSAVVQSLVARGAEVAAADETAKQPLHWAAMLGHASVVKVLTTLGASVAAVNKQGSQPLHFAAHRGSEEVVRLLLAHGASVAAEDERGTQPVHWAVAGGQDSIVDLLAGLGAGRRAGAGQEL